MPFDPLTWGLGFALNRLTARLLSPSSADILQNRLRAAVDEWSQELPSDLSVHYQQVFGEANADPDPESRPARFQLQESLITYGIVPTAREWLDALLEHWKVRRTELGPIGNAFFQLNDDEAVAHLSELARRIHDVCGADPGLARRTIILKLDQLLDRHDEDLARQQQLALIPYYARDLPTEVQSLIIDRPEAWEYLLFSAVLSHEIALHASLRRDYTGSVPLLSPSRMFRSRLEVFEWLRAHIDDCSILGTRISVLVKDQLQVAFGPPGVPGDPEAIVDVARKIGEIERSAIEWALALRRALSDSLFSPLLQVAERMVEDMIRQLGEYSDRLDAALREALNEDRQTPKTVKVTLVITMPDGVPEALAKELARLREYFAANPMDLL